MRRTRLVAGLSALLLPALGGCAPARHAPDPPVARATVSVTSSPPAPLPERLPVGHGPVSPADVVWAQGSVLHVGHHRVDVSPLHVDAFVVVRGGVYFLHQRELWLTDTRELRPTGVAGVASLRRTPDAGAVRVGIEGDKGIRMKAWDTLTGRAVPPAGARSGTPQERLGRPVEVRLRPGRSDIVTGAPQPARLGPGGRYGVLDRDSGPLTAFDAASAQAVPLAGLQGDGFELDRWVAPDLVDGLALQQGTPVAVLRCDLSAGRCRSWGSVRPGDSLVLESWS